MQHTSQDSLLLFGIKLADSLIYLLKYAFLWSLCYDLLEWLVQETYERVLTHAHDKRHWRVAAEIIMWTWSAATMIWTNMFVFKVWMFYGLPSTTQMQKAKIVFNMLARIVIVRVLLRAAWQQRQKANLGKTHIAIILTTLLTTSLLHEHLSNQFTDPITNRSRLIMYGRNIEQKYGMEMEAGLLRELQGNMVTENERRSWHQKMDKILAQLSMVTKQDRRKFVIIRDSPQTRHLRFNAFVVPGGEYVWISEKLIQVLDHEVDALAFVIAHELSHDILRHGAERLTTNDLISQAIVDLIHVVTDLDTIPTLFYGNYVMEKMVTEYWTRSTEQEADLLAFHLTANAGYSKYGGVAFTIALENVVNRHHEKKAPGLQHVRPPMKATGERGSLLRSHPSLRERRLALQELIAKGANVREPFIRLTYDGQGTDLGCTGRCISLRRTHSHLTPLSYIMIAATATLSTLIAFPDVKRSLLNSHLYRIVKRLLAPAGTVVMHASHREVKAGQGAGNLATKSRRLVGRRQPSG